MKKTVYTLGMLLIMSVFFLMGCGVVKQAGSGLPQDVVNKASGVATDNKASGPDSSNDAGSQDNQNQAVGSQTTENSSQAEAQANPKNSKSTDSKSTESKPAESNTVNNQNSGSVNQDKGNVSATATSQPVQASPKAVQKTVTITINCQTAVDKGLAQQEKFKNVVPVNGIILAPTTVELKDGETVFDTLKSIVRAKTIQMEYEGSKGTPYIQGINNLYEFDGGPLSGWMYCVNKVYPNYGCGQYKLKAGDVIEWNYTCNLGKDLGQEWVK